MRLLPGRVVRIFACVSKFDAFEDHSLRNCRGNYMDEVCSICCVKAGNSFVNDPNSNSSNDSPNPFSNNPPTTPVVLVGYVEMILTLYVELLLEEKLPQTLQALCDKLNKYIQEKQEEKNNAEEQAAKVSSQYLKPPIYYDDDDDDEESSIPLRDYF
ncbi:hypothetical protein Tco_0009316 [Tanacetum coccineum]